MNKEIKYKAWDKKSKKMREIDSIAFHGNGAFDNPTQEIKLVNLWGYDIIEDKHIIVQREPKDVELLEYTNLNDKHGTPIYEGDIVEVKEDLAFGGQEDFTGEIVYAKGAFWVRNSEKIGDVLLFSVISEREIIGNIYENPELLEVKS